MKTCQCCNIPKDESDFRKNKKKSDGLDIYCKECSREKDKTIYHRNIDKNRKLGWESKQKARQRNYEYVREYLQSHPCVDCGEKDIVVLEFDHIQEKDKAISHIIQNCSLKRLKIEIEKCEVRCANCHRRKTAKDFNYYRIVG